MVAEVEKAAVYSDVAMDFMDEAVELMDLEVVTFEKVADGVRLGGVDWLGVVVVAGGVGLFVEKALAIWKEGGFSTEEALSGLVGGGCFAVRGGSGWKFAISNP